MYIIGKGEQANITFQVNKHLQGESQTHIRLQPLFNDVRLVMWLPPDAAEKNRFFSRLPDMLDQFPPDLAKNKILPQLITAFEFGGPGSGSTILAPMFKVSKGNGRRESAGVDAHRPELAKTAADGFVI